MARGLDPLTLMNRPRDRITTSWSWWSVLELGSEIPWHVLIFFYQGPVFLREYEHSKSASIQDLDWGSQHGWTCEKKWAPNICNAWSCAIRTTPQQPIYALQTFRKGFQSIECGKNIPSPRFTYVRFKRFFKCLFPVWSPFRLASVECASSACVKVVES